MSNIKNNIKFDVDNFGIYLRNLREKKNLSQGEVAASMGYKSPQFISNWERGLSSPPLKALVKLADIFGVPREKLYKNFVLHINHQLNDEYKKIIRSGS